MSGQGIFTEDFQCGLGDFLEVGDQEEDDPEGKNPPAPKPSGTGADLDPKLKKDPFPPLDCALSASDMASKYKKALLNRQSIWKELHAKWQAANPATGQLLDQIEAMFFSLGLLSNRELQFFWRDHFFSCIVLFSHAGLNGTLWKAPPRSLQTYTGSCVALSRSRALPTQPTRLRMLRSSYKSRPFACSSTMSPTW